MSKKKHHRKYTLKELYDYLLNRKDSKSRHLLEREMQQNPFLEDAIEGYRDMPENKAKMAVADLNARIHHAKKSDQGSTIIAIAASIALLIVSMLSYFAVEEIRLSNKQNQFSLEQQVPEQAENEIKNKIHSNKNIEQENEVAASPQATLPQSPEEINLEIENDILEEEPIEIISMEEDIYIDTPVMEYPAIVEEPEPEPEIYAAGAQAPELSEQEAIAMAPKDNIRLIKGKIIDQQNGQPLPGVNITIAGTTLGTTTDINGNFRLEIPNDENIQLLANFIGMTPLEFSSKEIDNGVLAMHPDILSLNEIYVRRSGILQRFKREPKRNENQQATTPATAGEMAIWQKYLDENAILPDTATISKVEIILQFELDSEGKPINFETIESPDAFYTQQAQQLIMDGPLWVFKLSDAQPTHEKVELTIVFRKRD